MLESHRSALLSAAGQLEKLQRARSLAFTDLRDRKSLESAWARPVRPPWCIYHKADADCQRGYSRAGAFDVSSQIIIQGRQPCPSRARPISQRSDLAARLPLGVTMRHAWSPNRCPVVPQY